MHQQPHRYPKPELLAPAGSYEKMLTAFRYGADAVYLAGQNFGLRASAANFSSDEMRAAIRYAHTHGKKVYVTVNIYAHQEDLEGLKTYLASLEELGPDGLLISDPGVFALARDYAPSLPRQISTQASVTNAAACQFWYDLGVRRIVLARELTLDEIRDLRQHLPRDLELECFVHGAMCMSYSGRCLLSNYLTARDANRGRCSQPCRWRYSLVPHGHEDQPLDIEEDPRGSYLMSSRDLCLLPRLPDLVDAGISSLKIEGRMKGAYYVAVVVKAYREALDAYWSSPENYRMNPEALQELSAMVHRPFSTGFYFNKPAEEAQIFAEATYMKEAVVLGIVQENSYTGAPVNEDDKLSDTASELAHLGPNATLCEQRNKLLLGDDVQVVSPHGPTRHFRVERITDLAGQALESTPHPTMTYVLYPPFPLEAHSFLRRMGDKDRDPDAQTREEGAPARA